MGSAALNRARLSATLQCAISPTFENRSDTCRSASRGSADSMTTAQKFDLVVIGSGPAAEKGAAQAAYFGKKVAVVERAAGLGGACVHTGTLPSKTLREAALYLTGFQKRHLYGMTVEID